MSAAGKASRNHKGLSRSQARLAAVQALYQMDLAETDLDDVIDQFKAHRLGSEADNGTGTGAKPTPSTSPACSRAWCGASARSIR